MSDKNLDIKVEFIGEDRTGKSVKSVRQGLKGAKDDATLLSKSLKGVAALTAGAFTVGGAMKLAGALGEGVEMAAELDKGVREIGTLMGGLTKGEISAMRTELHGLAIESGRAVDTLVKAKYDVVSAGFSDAADSALILNKSARLAVGGVTEVSTSADLLTTILNAYRKEAKDAGEVSDDLFTIVRNGKTTMNELGAQMGQVIAIAGPLDVSLDEVGAAISTLTAQGQSTAIATTAISAAVSELSKPSKELQAALAAVDVTSDDLIKTGGGLAGALELVKKASDKTGISVNKLVAREEALRAILPLVSTASKKFARDLESMGDNAGSADKAFALMADGADHLKNQMNAAFDSAKRAVGEVISENEEYKELLKQIKEGVDKFATSVREGNPDFDKFVSNIMQFGSDVVKNAPGTLAEITKEIQGIYDAVSPLVDLAQNNPEMTKYGIIGGLLLGPGGAALGITLGYIKQVGDNLDEAFGGSPWVKFRSGLEDIEKQKQAWQEYSSSVRDAELSQEQMLAKTLALIAAAKNATESTDDFNEKGNASGNTTGKVEGLGSATGDKIEKAGDAARKAVKEVYGFDEAVKAVEADFRAWRETLDDATEALGTVDELLGRTSEETLTVKEAKEQLLDAEFAWNEAAALGVLGLEEQTVAYLQLTGAIDAARDARQREQMEMRERAYAIADVAEQLGLEGSGALYQGVTDFQKGDTLGGSLNLASFAGRNIGGSFGNSLTSAASMALAGLKIAGGNPIGAAIGGVVGLVSSLFGGGRERQGQEEREAAREEIYNAMIDSAIAGGAFSRSLLQMANYDFETLAEDAALGASIQSQYNIPIGWGHSASTQRFLDDRDSGDLQELQRYIALMDAASIAAAEFREASLSSSIREITVAYEGMTAQAKELGLEQQALAELEKARLSELVVAVTGITVDSMSEMAVVAMNRDARNVGEAFAETVSEALEESLRSRTISLFFEKTVWSQLETPLVDLSQKIVEGTLSSAELAAAVSDIEELATATAPYAAELASLLDSAGIGYSGTSRSSSMIEPAKPGVVGVRVPGFADGGDFAGGWRWVGERGPELEYTGPSRIASTGDLRQDLSPKGVEREIRAMRGELNSALREIASTLDEWRRMLRVWDIYMMSKVEEVEV